MMKPKPKPNEICRVSPPPRREKTTADLAASLSHLFVGNLLKGQTVGVIGAGCIVCAYAHMMIEGFKMNLIYYNLYPLKYEPRGLAIASPRGSYQALRR